MTQHDPRVAPADGDACDSSVLSGRQAPLARLSVNVLRGVVGLPDVALEGVYGEVVVRGADVGVAQPLAQEPERPGVVALRVLVVHHDLHAVLCGQVEEVLLLIAHRHGDVRDASSEQLLYLALDKNLPSHAQHPLGALVGEGDKAAGEACRQNDGVSHAVGLERRDAPLGDAAVLDEAGLLAGADGGLRRVAGEVGESRKVVWSRGRPRRGERAEDLELVSCERHAAVPT